MTGLAVRFNQTRKLQPRPPRQAAKLHLFSTPSLVFPAIPLHGQPNSSNCVPHHRHASSTGRSWTRRWQMAARERGSSRRLAAREGGGLGGRRSRARHQQGIDDATRQNSGLTARAPEQPAPGSAARELVTAVHDQLLHSAAILMKNSSSGMRGLAGLAVVGLRHSCLGRGDARHDEKCASPRPPGFPQQASKHFGAGSGWRRAVAFLGLAWRHRLPAAERRPADRQTSASPAPTQEIFDSASPRIFGLW